MAIIKIVNAQGGSDARYDVNQMTAEERTRFDSDGRPRGANEPGQWEWTPGLPGAREMNAEGGGGGGGGSGGFAPSRGAYGYDVAAAKLAYDRAVAQSEEGVQNLRKDYGFTMTDGKQQIDPNNRFGAIQLLLNSQGGQLRDVYDMASERHIGHKGLGAQGISDLRYTHGGQIANLGTEYTRRYKGFLQNKADALAAYNLAKQMAELRSIQSGSYYYGGGGGDGGSSGGSELPATGDEIVQAMSQINWNPAGTNINSVVGDSGRQEQFDLRRRALAQTIQQRSAPKKSSKKKPMGIMRSMY